MYTSEPRTFTLPVVQQYQGQKEIRTSNISIILSYRCTTGIKVDIFRFDYEFNNGNSEIILDLPDKIYTRFFYPLKLTCRLVDLELKYRYTIYCLNIIIIRNNCQMPY